MIQLSTASNESRSVVEKATTHASASVARFRFDKSEGEKKEKEKGKKEREETAIVGLCHGIELFLTSRIPDHHAQVFALDAGHGEKGK